MREVTIETLATKPDGNELERKTIVFQAPDSPHPETPGKRPYRFNHETLRDFQIAIDLNLNVLITGPTGCGKTSLPLALSAELGQPVIRFNCNGETRVSGLVGQQRPTSKEGVLTLEFSYGALVRAIRGGYWIILDEIDAASPAVLMVLQPLLEEGQASLHIPETDERLTPHDATRIFATGNTLGYRAGSRAQYAGTNPMNTAFLDRFGMVIAADYPDMLEEIERVTVNLPAPAEGQEEFTKLMIEGMCRVAANLRKDTSFRSDFSTRRLVQWGRLLPHYPGKGAEAFDVMRAFEMAVVRKLTSAGDARVAREVANRLFGYEKS